MEVKQFDIADSEIPSEILNFDKPLSRPREKKTAGKSNFLITYNANVSWRSLDTPDKKKAYAKQLISLGRNLEVNLRNKKLLKEFTGQPLANLTEYSFSLEQGTEKGFLHIHAVAMFDSYAQLRFDAMRKFCNQISQHEGKLDCQLFKDTTAVIKSYLAKQQNKGSRTLYSSGNVQNAQQQTRAEPEPTDE